ncbi:TonB-dependent receptor [Paraglaciecola sp. L3A3]|uniref:TonB-dependent receptor n=1 Tax=Paraglaciecola sp. L3A3 TaxID=2686358 RepID=UPI00131C00D5|nr:TonB-dependent receptor [Paraglaciecola sp. L3A3]
MFLVNSQFVIASSKTYQLSIEAGSTATSLRKLAEQTDLLILYPYDLVSQKTSAAINGKVTIDSGMSTILEGTNLMAVRNANGLYKIVKIPVTEVTSQPNEIATFPPEDIIDAIEEHLDEQSPEIISIVGRLSNYQKRFLKKRYSNVLVENVSVQNNKNHIQRNVGTLLQSAAGASTDYRKREGLFLTVRGFGPELNTVLYNNRQLPSTNLGSGFSFDTFSPQLFLYSDIYKTQTTELVSGGIGATINLVNQPRTNQKSFNLRGGIKLSASEDGDFFPELFGSVTYSGETIASIFSMNFLQQSYRIESANSDGWFAADLTGIENKEGSEDYSEIWVPRNFDLRIEQSEKQRFGLSWVSKLNITPNLYIITDLVYSRFDVESSIASSGNWTHINGNTENSAEKDTFDSISVDQNNTLLSYRYKSDLSFASDFVQLIRNRPSETIHFAGTAGYDFSQASNIVMDISYAVAKSNNGGNKRFSAVGSPNANPQYTLLENRPYANISFANSIDASDLRSHITIDSGDDVEDRIFQIKLDGETILKSTHWEQIKYGLYYADRTKEKIAFKTPWGEEFGGYEFDLPDEMFSTIDASGFLDGGVPEVWYGFDSQQYIDYLWSDEHIQQAIIDTNHPLAETIELRKQLGGFNANELPNSSWDVREELLEAYIKTFLSGQLFDLNWSAQMGVRLSATIIKSKGYDQGIQDLTYSDTDPTSLRITYAQSIPVSKSNNYVNWLPNINFKLELNDQQYINIGVSKTISRPSLDKLAPSIGEYVARTGASTAIRGNPQLQPYESINFDINWSWFFDDKGLIDLTFYYKSVDNFILQSVGFESLLAHPEGDFLVSTPYNADSTSFYGYEFVYQNQFESLPAPFDGTGIELRYTHVASDPLQANSSIREEIIEGLSDTLNLIFFYQTETFNASIIYNHRDEFVRKHSGLLGQPEMVDDYGQLDFKVSYQLSEKLGLFLEVQNLTNENLRSFSLFNERLLSYEHHQRIFTLGSNLRF